MESATLHSIPGLGELHVVRSPEQLQINGLWILLDSVHIGDLYTLYESQEVIIFDGVVTPDRDQPGERRAVQVTIRSLDTTVDETTGEVQVTASLEGLTAEDYVQ